MLFWIKSRLNTALTKVKAWGMRGENGSGNRKPTESKSTQAKISKREAPRRFRSMHDWHADHGSCFTALRAGNIPGFG